MPESFGITLQTTGALLAEQKGETSSWDAGFCYSNCPLLNGKALGLFNFFVWLVVLNFKTSMAIQGHRCFQLECTGVEDVSVHLLLPCGRSGKLGKLPKLPNSQMYWQVLASSDMSCGCAHSAVVASSSAPPLLQLVVKWVCLKCPQTNSRVAWKLG